MNEIQIRNELKLIHEYLMYNKFPYHSVSVIHRHQDMGFRVIFMNSVRNMVTDKIKDYIKAMGFTVSYIV